MANGQVYGQEAVYEDSTLVTDVISAVKACIKDDSDKNREAARVVADAADSAVVADNDVYTATVSAYSAAYAADAVVCTRSAAAHIAASYAINAGVDSTKVYTKMLRYGMRIMKEKKKC